MTPREINAILHGYEGTDYGKVSSPLEDQEEAQVCAMREGTREMTKRLVQSMVFLIVAAGLALPLLAAGAPPVIVGRVTDVEADLLRYVPEESDWVAAIRDVPFAAGDTFYSGNEGRAELHGPERRRGQDR